MFRLALILGLLSAIGPFAIDMYLPALPQIEADLATSVSATQLTLTAFFMTFGIMQLFYGPWADAVGRKTPLYLGLGIFFLGAVGCALAPSIGWLIACRAVQGMGGAAVMVIPRAVIRDRYTGLEATKLMALVMLVFSVSPMLAPLAGSGLLVFGGWRMIFAVMAGAAALGLVLLTLALPETLPPQARVPVNLRSLLRGAKVLFRDPVFMGLTMIGAFGMSSFFVFISNASFVYTNQFGLTPTQFSIAFAINAIGFFSASQCAAPLGARFGMVRVMRWAIMGFAAATCVLLAVVAAGFDSLVVVVVGLMLANACLGLVIPTTMVMALDSHGAIAGLASSLGGTIQMVTGGAMMALASLFFNGTTLPMVAAIALCAVLAFAISTWVLGRVDQPDAAQ